MHAVLTFGIYTDTLADTSPRTTGASLQIMPSTSGLVSSNLNASMNDNMQSSSRCSQQNAEQNANVVSTSTLVSPRARNSVTNSPLGNFYHLKLKYIVDSLTDFLLFITKIVTRF